MRVYKFYNQKYGLEALQRRRLKISTLKDLNDPFEFSAIASKDRETRKALESAREKTFQGAGLICFSKSWSNPVIWSHYAENHTGLSLGFDIPRSEIMDVIYRPNRLKGDISEKNRKGVFSRELQKAALLTKYQHWEYEHEARIFCSLVKPDRGNGLYFFDYDKIGGVKEIILGARYQATNDKALNNQILNDKIMVVTTRLSFQKFSVVPQRDKKLWKNI